jgi:two-component system sensor histidine kinase PilS (NtrC family)
MKAMKHSSSHPSPAGEARPSPHGPPWDALAIYNLFRLGLAAFMVGLWLSLALRGDAQAAGLGFPWLAGGALGSGCLAVLTIHRRLVNFTRQAHALLFLDCLLLTMAIGRHGLGHDVHVLFLAPVLVAALLLPRRSALFLAAWATLALLGTQGFRAWCCGDRPNTTATGIFGLIIFAGAMGGSVLKRRLDRVSLEAIGREQAMARLHGIMHMVVQIIQEGLIVLDERGMIRFINPEARRLLGGGEEGAALQGLASELFGCHLHDRAVPLPTGIEVVAHSIAHVERGENLQLIVLEDTHRLGPRLEAIKLRALARLAGGIAHEIRNPLMTLRQAAALLAEDMSEKGEQQGKLLEIIDRHAERINAIIESILGLSRMQPGNTEVMVLPEFLTGLTRRHARPGIPVHLECDSDLPPVLFDPNHLEQVLGNLLRNACQHGDCGDGSLRIRIIVTREQDACIIDVLDNGPGLHGQSIGRIFEPFHSTGGGAGLGLFLARELCVHHGAELRACEGPGGWFRVRLRWA